MNFSFDMPVNNELINQWLFQCIKCDKQEINEKIDITWCLKHGADVNTTDSECNTPLHVAVDRKDVTFVNLLLKHGADVNAKGRWEYTPLHVALTNKDVTLVDLLLKHGADVNTRITDSETPLHVAVRFKDAVLVDRLLKCRADVNSKNSGGDTALHVAVDSGDSTVIEQLLQYGADVSITNKHRDTPLHLAVQRGDATNVDLLLKYGADLKVTNAPGDTPLHLAARSKETSSVELLLKYGADVSVRNKRGEMPIHDAARSGDVSVVELLLKYGADVKMPNKSGCTSLHISVVYGKTPLIELMLSSGININTIDGTGDTPLHLSVSCNKSEIVELLLKYDPDVSIKNNRGDTPLQEAVRSSDASIVDQLLKYGANVDIKDTDDDTPLHLAVRRGNATIVDQLLKYGANPKITNKTGYTPLHLAAIYGKALILDLMLTSGVDVNTTNEDGDTSLHLAVSANKTAAVDLLLKYGANVSITNIRGETPLYQAVGLGGITIVDQLLKCEVGLNTKENGGYTPLHLAAARGDADLVEKLLKCGADMKIDNSAGNTALHLAVCSKNINVVELLLKYGAEVSITNKCGDMPIHEAARSGDVLIMDTLLKYGAAVDIKNSKDETPLHLAVQNEDTSIVDLLLKYGAKINSTNKIGHTPLHKAVVHEKIDVVDLLLNSGFDIDAVDIAGNTPLHLAVSSNKTLIIDLLLKRNADVNITNGSGETPMYPAVHLGAINVVEQLIKYGASINTKDNNANTLLHLAVQCDNTILVKLLLKYDSDVNTTNKYGETPLHLALRQNNISIIDLLLEYGSGKDTTNTCDDMSLNIEAAHNNFSVGGLSIKWETDDKCINSVGDSIITKGAGKINTSVADITTKKGSRVSTVNKVGCMSTRKEPIKNQNSTIETLFTSEVNLMTEDEDGHTPLHLTGYAKESSAGSFILSKRVNVNVIKNQSETLFLAVRNEDEYLLELLLNSGCDVNVVNKFGDSPLHEAVDIGNVPLVSMLLKHKANLNTVNSSGDTPLHLATRNGNALIVEMLLKSTTNNATINSSGYAPLHIGAANRNWPNAGMMLRVDSDSEEYTIDEADNTSLHLKESQNDINAEDKLSKYSADLNMKNRAGDTPLHLATYCNEVIIVKRLLKYGADVNSTNKRIETPLYWAVRRGDTDLVNHLLKCGANVDQKDNTGDTPLHLAVHRGDASIVDLLLQFSADVNSMNRAGNTPLHLAARRKHAHIAHILLCHGADVTLRNLCLDTPLTVARIFNFEGYEDIVGLLETAETLAKNNGSQNKDQLQTLNSCPTSPINDRQNIELPGFKYLKRRGTSGVCGQLYETKLLCLVLIRALNENQIENFLLGTNVRGIGDMDDICVRYRIKDQNKSVVLFVQAKHRENPEKGQLTVDDVQNISGDFSLRKYFESYLKIKDRFQIDNEDPMFEGKFGEVECNFVIYTPVSESFKKKVTGQQPSEKVHYLINTGQNTEVFQYNYNEDDINNLTKLTTVERLKQFGIVFLELIMSEKDKYDALLQNKLISRHHVVIGREVLYQCKEQQTSKEYRIWQFRPDFFKSKCEYLLALKSTLIKELATKRYDKSKITSEDLKTIEEVLLNPCATTISKIIGKTAIYNSKSEKLQLLDLTDFDKLYKKTEFQTILKSYGEINVNESIINEAVCIKMSTLEIKLPVAFSNTDMIFRGSEVKVKKRIKAVTEKLMALFAVYKETKIVNISEDIIGPGKIIERGIIDINGGIGSAIGNLLVLDKETKLLKLNLDNKNLPEKAALFLKELESDRYTSINKDLKKYRILINIEGFPKDSFEGDQCDTIHARFFLKKLWFYTNQAKENEVERILKNHINTYYNYEKETNNLLFEIHTNAIFLRSHDDIQKWWMHKGETCYLTKESDIFGRAKLACINNLFQTLVDYMQYFNISCMDFKFNQRIHQQENSIEIPAALNTTLGKLFEIFDTQDKLINISVENKKDIADLLQTAERLARDTIPPSDRKPSQTVYSTPTDENAVTLKNNSQNNVLSKFKYFKRSGSSGVSGQLYETKLLCLVLIRALNDEDIEPFFLGTNICGIGEMDDICLRYHVKNQGKPIVLFMQAKHRENSEKRKVTVEDIRNASGDFSLRKYFDGYLKIKDKFQTDDDDPMFKGDFDNVECNFIIYTPVKDSFTKKMTGKQPSEKVNYLIHTGQKTNCFQYNYGEDDIYFLTEITVLEQLKAFGAVFLGFIMSTKLTHFNDMFCNKLLARYHVIIGRKVLQQCKLQVENKEYRIWQFRSEFFESNCKYLLALKNTLIKELSTKCYDTSNITNEDQNNLKQVIRQPCAFTISKIIGKLAIYNDKNKTLQIAKLSKIENQLNKDEYKMLLEKLNKIVIYESVINEAVRIKLTSLEIKLPNTFGNLDMTFHGSNVEVQNTIKIVSDKLINLLKACNKTKLVNITKDSLECGKNIERGIHDIIGSIKSAIGNLLIVDTDKKALKFNVNEQTLPKYAALLLEQLKNDRHKLHSDEISKYRIQINIEEFPKSSFEGDEFDKKLAKDFLNNLWFYTEQAKENEVELILKEEINKYYKKEVFGNRHLHRSISDPVFFISHDEIQKWWMQIDGSPYLSRASELFERAELADIDNLLLTVVNFMYISRIHSIDINIKHRVDDYKKFVQMHETFNRMAGRLFIIFDSEFNETTDIKLPTELLNIHGKFDFGCDLVFSLEIHPEMEWVALKLLAQVWVVFHRVSYSLIAKAGPGCGHQRPKDGFLLQQRFRDRQQYFFEGGKDPLDLISEF